MKKKLVIESGIYYEQPKDIRKQIKKLVVKIKGGAINKQQLQQALFWRPLPTIDDFLSPEHLGDFANFVFPKWKQFLKEDVFYKGSVVNELILGGAIGCGKTSIGELAQYINLTKILCYRNPQYIFGMSGNTRLAIIFISITKGKTSLALMDKFKSFLQASEWYAEVKKKSISIDTVSLPTEDGRIPYTIERMQDNEIIRFPNRVMLYGGSMMSDALSMDLVGALFDEAEFRRGGISEAFNTYTGIKERINNRFLGRRHLMLTLISSEKKRDGVIQSYIDSLAPDDPHIAKAGFAVWEVREFDAYKKGNFWVFVGNKRNPSRLLEKEEAKEMRQDKSLVPKGCSLLKVPKVHRREFETDLIRALNNLAGVSVEEEETVFDNLGCLRDYDKNLFPYREVEAPLMSATRLVDTVSQLFVNVPGLGWKLKRAPNAPRYIHYDHAETTEAGVAMVHKELAPDSRVMYVLDFLLKVTSPDRIDLEKLQDLTEDLVRIYRVPIMSISADQYQSSQFLQHCFKQGLASDFVGRQSVVTDVNVYLTVARLVNVGVVATGKVKELIRQLKPMKLDSFGRMFTPERKDVADAYVGAVYRAFDTREDVPEYFYHEYSPDYRRIFGYAPIERDDEPLQVAPQIKKVQTQEGEIEIELIRSN